MNFTYNTSLPLPPAAQNQNDLHPHKYEPGNIGWMLVSTAFVFLMIPGVGYFYSGMAKTKHALSLIMLSCWSIAVVYIQVKEGHNITNLIKPSK